MGNHNRTTDRSDVAVELGGPTGDLWGAVIVEEEICTPVCRASLALQYAMQGVGTGLQGRVEDATASSTHLRVIGVLLDLDLVHRFNRMNDNGAVAEVGDGNI